MRQCEACGKDYMPHPRSAWHQRYCSRVCRYTVYRQPYDPVNYRRWVLHTRYRMTPEGLEALRAKQGGLCAICRQAEGDKYADGRLKDFSIDHDHTCCPGERSCGRCVRGLLCRKCNVGIGNLRETPAILRAAADYIQNFRLA